MVSGVERAAWHRSRAKCPSPSTRHAQCPQLTSQEWPRRPRVTEEEGRDREGRAGEDRKRKCHGQGGPAGRDRERTLSGWKQSWSSEGRESRASCRHPALCLVYQKALVGWYFAELCFLLQACPRTEPQNRPTSCSVQRSAHRRVGYAFTKRTWGQPEAVCERHEHTPSDSPYEKVPQKFPLRSSSFPISLSTLWAVGKSSSTSNLCPSSCSHWETLGATQEQRC